MKTIEERANEYALEQCGGIVRVGSKGMIYAGSKERYNEIAREQLEHDIEWLYNCKELNITPIIINKLKKDIL